MNKIKTVIFDLGKVLINWEPQRTAREISANHPSFNMDICKITQSPFWYLFDIGYITSDEMLDHFSNEFPLPDLQLFFQEAMKSLSPLPFGMNLLKEIRENGFTTYILSNMSKEFFDWISSQYTILNDFQGAVYSYEVHMMKPDFRIYQYLLSKYGLDPKECLFIDDMDCNVFSAKKVGLNSILYQPTEATIKQLQELEIL